MPNILLCVTGSVAAVKTAPLIASLQAPPLNGTVRVVLSRSALHFQPVDRVEYVEEANCPAATTTTDEAGPSPRPLPDTSPSTAALPDGAGQAPDLSALSPAPNADGSPVLVYTDRSEWAAWRAMGDPVLHIELRKWADVLVIAPLSANTLAKMSGGLCDTLITCVVRAWQWGPTAATSRPIVIAPAMNPFMWTHPHTGTQLRSLHTLYNHPSGPNGGEGQATLFLVPPVTKRLACGDTGVGAMAHPADIAECVHKALERRLGDNTLDEIDRAFAALP